MLLPCPYCDNEVIEGADTCDSCGQPLTESHLPIPATAVERALLTDRVWQASALGRDRIADGIAINAISRGLRLEQMPAHEFVSLFVV